MTAPGADQFGEILRAQNELLTLVQSGGSRGFVLSRVVQLAAPLVSPAELAIAADGEPMIATPGFTAPESGALEIDGVRILFSQAEAPRDEMRIATLQSLIRIALLAERKALACGPCELLEALPQAGLYFDAEDRLAAFNTQGAKLFPDCAIPPIGLDARTILARLAPKDASPAEARAWVERVLLTSDATSTTSLAAGPRRLRIDQRRLASGRRLVLVEDITERDREYEALRRKIEVLELTLENIDEGITSFDPEDRILVANSRATEMLATPPGLIRPGTSFRDIVRWRAERGHYGPGDPDALVADRLARMDRSRYTGATFKQNEPITGRIYEVRRNMLPNGGTVLVYRDVTELETATAALRLSEERLQERVVELEATRQSLLEKSAELARARDDAEAASRTKSEFLANMSHELRTPLNAVIGFSEIIRNELFGPCGNPQYVAYAQDILDSGRHLLAIINDILDLSKLEAGKLELSISEVDLGSVLASCERLVRGRAQEGRVALSFDNAEPGRHIIAGDEIKLKQVFLNLISNAVKFTPPDGRVDVSVVSGEDGEIEIIVADTGIGMTPEQIPIALQPFRQVDASLARRHEGTGLGLPLARALAELHGARFTLESEPGVGTTVRVAFPSALAAMHRPEPPRMPESPQLPQLAMV